jgi:hypothetical protein
MAKIPPKTISSTRDIKKIKTGILVKEDIMETNNTSFFVLYIYKTANDMMEGIKLFHRNFFNIPFVSNTIFDGMFIPTEIINTEVNDEHFINFGAMFLNKEKLTLGTIAHECLHAAFSNERTVVCYKGNYAGDTYLGNDPEERLVYKFQSYFEQIYNICNKAKMLSDTKK